MTVRLFALLVCVYLLVASREPPWADAHVTYDTTQALVERGELNVSLPGPPQFYATREGKKYGVFPLGNVIAMVPSYVTYKTLHELFPSLPDKPLYATVSHLAPTLMMAGACVLFFLVLVRRGASERAAAWAALALGLTTLCFIYARATYSEALQTVALMWLVERTLKMAERPTQVGMGWLAVCAGILVNAKLVNVLLLVPVPIYLIVCARRSAQLGRLLATFPLVAVCFAPFVGLALAHNQVKTGTLFDSGYRIPNGIFSGDLFAGLYGFFLSSGKSVFLYSPPLVLVVLGVREAWRQRRGETMFIVSIIVINLLFNAKFRHWHADYCWGPRHLVGVTPLAGLLVFPWLPEALSRGAVRVRQAAVAGLLIAGLLVQLLGASLYWDHYIRALIAVKDQTGASGWFTEHLTHGHYLPPFSPLRGQWWMLRHLILQDKDLAADAPWRSMVPAEVNLSEQWGRLRVDWWPLEWQSDVPKENALTLALSVELLLLIATVVAALALRRELSRARAPV